MNKTILALAVASTAFVSASVTAEEPVPFTQQFTSSGDVTLASDYRFRGISLTTRDPALQGSFTLSHDTGLYANVWASSVEIEDASLEIDYTIGFSHEAAGVGYSVAFVYYTLPASDLDADYGEILADVNYGHSVLGLPAMVNVGAGYTDDISIQGFTFNNDNKYLYLHAEYSLEIYPDLYVNLHGGHTDFIDHTGENYYDYSAGVSTTLVGFDWAVDYVSTDLNDLCGTDCDGTFVASVSKGF